MLMIDQYSTSLCKFGEMDKPVCSRSRRGMDGVEASEEVGVGASFSG